MKKIINIFILILLVNLCYSQSYYDHRGIIRMLYGSPNDIWQISFTGDTVYYYSTTNPFHKFNGGVIAGDSLRINGGEWIKSIIGGTGTPNYIPYFSGSTTLADSPLSINAGNVSASGQFRATNFRTDSTTVSIGLNSGFAKSLTGQNIFIGDSAGYFNQSSDAENIAIGYAAGRKLSGGSVDNVIIGWKAGKNITDKYDNTIVGAQAGYFTNSHANTFLGTASGYSNSSGENNTFLGENSGYSNTTGSNNIFIGRTAGYKLNTYSNRLLISSFGGTTIADDTTKSIIYGYQNTDPSLSRLTANALFNANNIETNKTTYSTKFGIGSGNSENESAERDNVFIGYQSGYSATTGDGNTFIGFQSGYSTTSSGSNLYAGYSSGYSNTTGYSNVFSGANSGYSNTTGYDNLFIGANAGYSNTTSNSNVFMGNGSGYNNTTSNNNIFIGFNSGYYIDGYSNRFVVSTMNTGSLVNDTTKSLIYSYQDADPSLSRVTINANVNIPYNLTVGQLLIHDKYEAAAYLRPDSTISTDVTTNWIYLGDGDNNKFTNIYADGFSLDGDTLVFNQDSYDTRDSVEFRLSYSCATSTSNVNKTIYYTIRTKSTGGDWVVQEQTIGEVRTITAGIYYSGAICTPMPVYLKDDDKVQISIRNAANTSTVSTKNFKVYIHEE